MSRTLETRMVEGRVAVYTCDRCGAEMPETPRFGVSRPGEGTQLSSRSDEKWEPLVTPTGADLHALAEASNVDLCDRCLGSLREWMRSPDSFQESKP